MDSVLCKEVEKIYETFNGMTTEVETDEDGIPDLSVHYFENRKNPEYSSSLTRMNSSIASLSITTKKVKENNNITETQRKPVGHQKKKSPIMGEEELNLHQKTLITQFESDSDEDMVDGMIERKKETTVKKNMTPTGLKEYLKYCKSIREVPISKFSRSLSSNTISLTNQDLHGKPIKACAMALIHNRISSHVDFEGCEIGPEGAKHIADVLLENEYIKELNLRRNKLGKEGLAAISKALKQNDTLMVLDLSDNNFQETDAQYIKEILLESNLRELNISNNHFGGKTGSRTIAEGLANNSGLLKFNISWNHLKAEGAAIIGCSLFTNESLEVLNISWNGIDVPGCHALGHSLDKNSSLRELDTSSNRINLTGLCKLLEGMKNNKTLEVLKLQDNPITNQGALEVLMAIDHYECGIRNIDFGKQPVDEDFIIKLQSLRQNMNIIAKYGKVCFKPKGNDLNTELDRTMYIKGDPLLILLEFSRMKELRVLDLFVTLDMDGSHSVSWDEFRMGIKISHIPIRPRDIDGLIKQMDIDQDGEINFSELIIAQKEHDAKVEKLMKKGIKAFDDSPLGQIHKQLHKWFEDKEVLLKT